MTLTFSSNGKHYTATSKSVFMDNGATIMFIERGRDEPIYAKRPMLSRQEWQRLLPQLEKIDYETYYGRKALLPGVSIYQVKR